MSHCFVFQHGAWLTGESWDNVRENLESKGHTVVTPTLPGNNGQGDPANVVYQDYITHLSSIVLAQKQPVILVGHASGGHIIQSTLPHIHKHIKMCIFNNAFLLENGQSQFDVLPKNVADIMRQAAKDSTDGTIPSKFMYKDTFLMINESYQCRMQVMALSKPQPICIFDTPMDANALSSMEIDYKYIYCMDDTAMPGVDYIEMSKLLGRDSGIFEIAGGHTTHYCNPELYTNVLLHIVS